MCWIPRFHCGSGIPPCDINNSTTVSTIVFQSESHYFVMSLHHLWSSHHILTPKDLGKPTFSPPSWSSSYESHLSFPRCFLPTTNRPPKKTPPLPCRRFHGLGLNWRHVIASGSFRPGMKRTSHQVAAVGWLLGGCSMAKLQWFTESEKKTTCWEIFLGKFPMSPKLLSYLDFIVGKGTPAKINTYLLKKC